MIGRMRPFYQAHWDISKDIKHVWLLICTYYIAWIFQWILSGEGRGKWWDRQYRVWIPQCAAPLDVTVTYARDSFVDSPSVLRPGWHMQETALWIPRGAFCPLEGGPRHIGTDTLAPVLHWHKMFRLKRELFSESENEASPTCGHTVKTKSELPYYSQYFHRCC